MGEQRINHATCTGEAFNVPRNIGPDPSVSPPTPAGSTAQKTMASENTFYLHLARKLSPIVSGTDPAVAVHACVTSRLDDYNSGYLVMKLYSLIKL